MSATSTTTRWWWVRHAPVRGHDGRLYGNLDVDCDCADDVPFRALAARLPGEAVWIVTPLRRTQATAAAIAHHLPTPPENFHVEARLAEQNFGDWQGRAYVDLEAEDPAAWQRFWSAPAAAVPPGGESFTALAGRVAEAVEALTRRHAGRDIVCVSHGGPIRAALAHALALSPARALSFAVDSCSLTRLDHIAEAAPGGGLAASWRITLVNGCG